MNFTDSGFIQYEEGISISMVKGVDYYYKMIPENIRNRFEREGWKIIVSNQSLKDKFNFSNSVQAVFLPSASVIYIDNRTVAQPSVIHEMGHYIDYVLGYVTDTSEFADIYREEVEGFKIVYYTHENNTNTQLEYFAEFFWYMILNPTSAKQTCPRTYDFVMQCTNAIN